MKALRRIHQHHHGHDHDASNTSSSSSLPSWIKLRSVMLILAQSSSSSSTACYSPPLSSSPVRGSIRSCNKRRKHALLPKLWKSLFTPDGKLMDGGVKFLKKVRNGGVDPQIREEVWPFLLGVYDINSSEEERKSVRIQNRKEYESLRRRCKIIMAYNDVYKNSEECFGNNSNVSSRELSQSRELSCSHELTRSHELSCCQELSHSWVLSQILGSFIIEDESDCSRPLSAEGECPGDESPDRPVYDESPKSRELMCQRDGDISMRYVEYFPGEKSMLTCEEAISGETMSTESDSSEETIELQPSFFSGELRGNDHSEEFRQNPNSFENGNDLRTHINENFAQWQKIIRLDAIRADDEWISYSPLLTSVSSMEARTFARNVRLKDYEQLEPCRIYHTARLVAILEAYALYDPEIGYCQGMSDLLNPIISVIGDDCEAFWCFVGFMKKARSNFQLDEVGIRRQLNIVANIIKSKDIQLYKHLEKLQADDCFFLYRMVLVLFRRELTLEQTLCLWEVMWADQAAIRAGIAKSAWGKMRLKAPPTDDLLLYAIAAFVLKRRKLIIEMYSSMEEIMRECQSMAGHLDVWKLLDDAHALVATLHEKI